MILIINRLKKLAHLAVFYKINKPFLCNITNTFKYENKELIQLLFKIKK